MECSRATGHVIDKRAQSWDKVINVCNYSFLVNANLLIHFYNGLAKQYCCQSSTNLSYTKVYANLF